MTRIIADIMIRILGGTILAGLLVWIWHTW